MRYIDADKLQERLQEEFDKEGAKADEMAMCGCAEASVKYNHGQFCYLNAKELVKDAPTAAVAPIADTVREMQERFKELNRKRNFKQNGGRKEMKKVLIAVVLIVSVMLAGCGNMSIGVGNYEFKGIHIGTYNGVGCHEIESWHDNESGIEVKIKGGNSIYVSEGTTYILYEKECPICSKNNKTNNFIVSDINLQTSSDNLKTPLEWAKIEIASDERYEGQHVMFSVIPIEDSTLGENEALYFIIAITEESDLVMDWYGVHLEWEGNGDKVSRDQVKVDADLFKTEIIGDDGVILDYDDGKIIGDNGEVVIGGK